MNHKPQTAQNLDDKYSDFLTNN